MNANNHFITSGFDLPIFAAAMKNPRIIRIGTRQSALASWQANWVAAALREKNYEVEIIGVETRGDVTTGPLTTDGGEGLFTKAIQNELLADRVDLAVHSLKDLPTEPIAGLTLAATPKRESTADALISSSGKKLADLRTGARVGTGSTRRRAQLLHSRPDLQVIDIRGNLDTRLAKLETEDYDAIILAEAGLTRLNWGDRITELLVPPLMLPAVGQGALGLEIREGDTFTADALGKLNDCDTLAAVLAERSMLRSLRAGCMAPVGAHTQVVGGELKLEGVILSRDGVTRITTSVAGKSTDAELLGKTAADQLLAQGGAKLIADES